MKKTRMTNQIKEHAQNPDICGFEDKVFIAYQVCRNGIDDIEVCINTEKVNEIIYNTNSIGQSYLPKIFCNEKIIYLSYSEFDNDKWSLYLVVFKNNVWEDRLLICESKCVFKPELIFFENKIWIFYSQYSDKPRAVCKNVDEKSIISDEIILHNEFETYRPIGTVCKDGNLFAIFDLYNGSDYLIFCGVYKDRKFETCQVSETDGFATGTNISVEKNGILLMWSQIKDKSYQNYSDATITYENGNIKISDINISMEGNTWSLYQDIDSNSKFGVFNNSRGIIIRKRIENLWDFPFQVEENKLTIFPRKPKCYVDNHNNINLVYQKSKGNGHTWTRNSEIMYTRISESEYDEGKNENIIGVFENFNTAVKKRKIDKIHTEKDIKKYMENSLSSYKGLSIFWGDIHGQSKMSDGIGEVDQYFNYAKCKANMDFAALTDHDIFPDTISPAEWEFIKSHCNYFNKGDLVTLLAYEWTSNEFRYDYGHKNVYFRGDGPYYSCVSEEGYSPDKLFYNMRNEDVIIIPHHMGAVWEVVLASTDWNYHDENLQPVTEVLSRHAVFETDHDYSPYTKNVQREEGNSAVDILKKGIKVGFVGGSDSHQLEAGVEGGITGVFVEKLSRENVFDSIKLKHTIASTGARIMAQFEINENMSGSEFSVNYGDTVEIKAHILATDNIKLVEIINNGNILKSYSNCNESLEINEQFKVTEDCWTYLRIVQEDEHLVLVSPIWICVNGS